jgi:xanthine dehydrogenase small subunit
MRRSRKANVPVAVNDLTLQRPKALAHALRMLGNDPSLEPIAGCTDVYVGLHFGTTPQRKFIDLWDLKELRGISLKDDVLRIGATTTYTQIIQSRVVQKRVPMLVAASREVGGAQIQNRGTLGGNVANASPAGDTLPVLAAAGARIVLRSQSATRTVPFEDFYTGYRQSVRKPDELIVAIEIPPVDGKQWWRKVGTRRAQAISKIMMAGVRSGKKGGTAVRIAVGSVGPTVVLARKAAAILSSGGAIADAKTALLTEIAPIDDVRSTREYRSQVAANLLEQFWSETR